VITRTVKVTNVGKPSVAEERSEITPATAIKVTPTSGTVEKGKTTTLTVSFEPESATDKTFRAVSADPSTGTIAVKDMVITVTGVKAGKVSIPVISGNGQFATVAEVTVTEAGAAG
ncbi:Ig domain-containing protein, partial [Escherichia coli]|nr:Ig domain-containing protein [Escherichia coli]